MDVYVSNVKENISGQGIVTMIESDLESEEQYIKAYEEVSREDTLSDSVFTASSSLSTASRDRRDKNVRFSFISEVLDRDIKRRIATAPDWSVDRNNALRMINEPLGKRTGNH